MNHPVRRRIRRTLTATLVAFAATVLAVNYGAPIADATESHVTADPRIECDETVGTINVHVYATDHGQNARMSDAYVLSAGVFDGPLSTILRGLYAPVVFATGPNAGDPGPTVTRSFTARPGAYTVAVTLGFDDGTTSTGTAAVQIPIPDPCPTTTPATTPTSTPTTSTPTTAPPAGTSTSTPPAQLSTPSTISGSAVTLPRTGASGPVQAGAAGAGLVLAGCLALALVRIARRRPRRRAFEGFVQKELR